MLGAASMVGGHSLQLLHQVQFLLTHLWHKLCLPEEHLKRNNRDVAKQNLEELDRARGIWLSCLPSVWNSCVNPISWTLGYRMDIPVVLLVCLYVLLSELCKRLW